MVTVVLPAADVVGAESYDVWPPDRFSEPEFVIKGVHHDRDPIVPRGLLDSGYGCNPT
jgi:hypothetical protein